MTEPNPRASAALKDLLTLLKLNSMREALDEQLTKACVQGLPVEAVLESLFRIEHNALIERRIKRRIKEARLPELKLLQDYDFQFQTGVDKQQILSLATLDFVARGQSLVLGGHSGTGKSHIAKALMLIGCRKTYRCRYTTAAEMLSHLKAGLVDDTLEHKLKAYVLPDLLLIDELGFDRLEQDATRPASLFFKVVDARYGKKSTILTTNMDFPTLGKYLGDPIMTAAMLDRLVHHAMVINIEGPSWRMFESRKLNQNDHKPCEVNE